MSTPRSQRGDGTLDPSSSAATGSLSSTPTFRAGRANPPAFSNDGAAASSPFAAAPNPTYASFSPATLSSAAPSAASVAKRRSTILVHQKSPLLLATPPQITRALAYSHPFLLPLNKLAGLMSWTTGDPWESFLLVAAFWAVVLYGDMVLRLAGPVVLVLILIGGMYGRRFSPLSSSGLSDPAAGTGDGSVAPGGGGGDGTGTGTGTAQKKTGKSKNLSVVDTLPADHSSSPSSSSNSNNNNKAAKGPSSTTAGQGGGAASAKGSGHQRGQSSCHISEITNTRHHKTLDEMVETLKEFTGRCNILLEPLLELTDFLSTQRTPISATTRPALTTLLVRILLCTPFWFALTLPPLRIVTTRRLVLVWGTLVLTWHARVMRIARAILWRSATVRRAMALVTGLDLEAPVKRKRVVVVKEKQDTAAAAAAASPSMTALSFIAKMTGMTGFATGAGGPVGSIGGPRESELTKALRGGGRVRAGSAQGLATTERQKKPARDRSGGGVRFTFIIYENQRRWIGLGWTTSLFAYERPAWTDEHQNTVPPRDEFYLPEVDSGTHEDGVGDGGDGERAVRMCWRWVDGSRWRVDGVPDEAVMPDADEEGDKEWDFDGPGGRMGWVYYDNKWQNGQRGQDGWGRWTRRRKWYRDAELVEVYSDDEEEDDDESGEVPDESKPRPDESKIAPAENAARKQLANGFTVKKGGYLPTPAPRLPPRVLEEEDGFNMAAAAGAPPNHKGAEDGGGGGGGGGGGVSIRTDSNGINIVNHSKDSLHVGDVDDMDAASIMSTSSHISGSGRFASRSPGAASSSLSLLHNRRRRGATDSSSGSGPPPPVAGTAQPSRKGSGGGSGSGSGSIKGAVASPQVGTSSGVSTPARPGGGGGTKRGSSSFMSKHINGSLSRRSSNGYGHAAAGAASDAAVAVGMAGPGTEEEDTAALLGTRIGLALQDAARHGSSWGVGDEVRMGLE